MLKEVPAPSFLEIKKQGLCSTCNNSTSCAYRLQRGFDALYCEMFDNHTPPIIAASLQSQSSPSVVQTRTANRRNEQVKGLCMNCEKYESCGLPKSESGVWHCEEYE